MKKIYSILLMIACAIMLVACGDGSKSEEDIVEDMNESNLIQDYAEQGYVDCRISNINITKRNIVEEQTDDIYGQIEVSNDEVKIIQNVHLLYNYYSENGWIFDQYMLEEVEVILPLKGVSEKSATDMLEVYGLYKTMEVTGQNTNLEEGLDEVIVSVSTETDLCKISGDIAVKYYFDNGQWMYQSIEMKENYAEEWNLTGSWFWDGRNQGDGIRVYLVSEDNTCKPYYISFYDDDSFRECLDWDEVVWEVADVFEVSADGVARRIVEQGGNIRDLLYGNITPYGIENYGTYFEKISDEIIDIEEYIKRFQTGSDPTLDDDIELIRKESNELLSEYSMEEELMFEAFIYEVAGMYVMEPGSEGIRICIYSDTINLADYMGSLVNLQGYVEKTEEGNYILRVSGIEELDIDWTQVS